MGWGGDKLGVWDYQIQTTIYKTGKQQGLLYGTGNYIQNPVIKHNGKEYIYVQLNHFAVHQKLTQHCKSTILQLQKIWVLVLLLRKMYASYIDFIEISATQFHSQ